MEENGLYPAAFEHSCGGGGGADVQEYEGAFAALNDGDEETHNRLIQEAARSLAGRAEIIVFAQISMVRALQAGFNPGTEIVTSPEVSARTLVKLIKERGEQRG